MLREGLVGTIQAVTAFGLPSLLNLGCHWFDRVLDFAGNPEIAWVAGTIDSLMDEPPASPRYLDPPVPVRSASPTASRPLLLRVAPAWALTSLVVPGGSSSCRMAQYRSSEG